MLGTSWSLVSAGHNHSSNHSSLLLSDSSLHLGGRTWFNLLHFSHSAFSASAALSLLDHTGCLTVIHLFFLQDAHKGIITTHDLCDLLPIQLPHWIIYLPSPPSLGSRNTGGWWAVGQDQFAPASGPPHWLLCQPCFSGPFSLFSWSLPSSSVVLRGVLSVGSPLDMPPKTATSLP